MSFPCSAPKLTNWVDHQARRVTREWPLSDPRGGDSQGGLLAMGIKCFTQSITLAVLLVIRISQPQGSSRQHVVLNGANKPGALPLYWEMTSSLHFFLHFCQYLCYNFIKVLMEDSMGKRKKMFTRFIIMYYCQHQSIRALLLFVCSTFLKGHLMWCFDDWPVRG